MMLILANVIEDFFLEKLRNDLLVNLLKVRNDSGGANSPRGLQRPRNSLS